MATVVMTPQKPVSPLRYVEGDDYVLDTRTPSPIMRGSSSSEDEKDKGSSKVITGDSGKKDKTSYQPDLSSEVSMLSTKLINAINYQTTLDDTLQATRHQLEQAQTELKRVRAEKQTLDEAIAEGLFVKKVEFDTALSRLRTELAEERARREAAERLKKQTEGEVETLTSALFEEANTMVAAARKDTEAAEKRNSQLKSQLQDTEFLLSSQQEQLQDLKQTMEKLESSSTEPRDPSMPSTPIMSSDTSTWDPQEPSTMVDINPEHPLYFSQLLHPVLRTDVNAYTDFAELLSIAKRTAPHSRNASGNQPPPSQNSTSASMSGSSPNLPGAFTFASSGNSSPSSSTLAAAIPSLKETKFYKRALLEDVEPTLRLDLAPGLSFLSRRSVLSSLLNGTLAVEPFVPSNYRFYAPVFACALCGESRKQDPYVRKHRFRTSESEDAQRYPLCDYCLGRIRATGDFLGFLRMVKDGYWRCESEENERGAWEEAVRLRERMFWARVGGGVIPAAFKKEVVDAAPAKDQTVSAAQPSGEDAERKVEGPQQLEQDSGAMSRELDNKTVVNEDECAEERTAEVQESTTEVPSATALETVEDILPPETEDNASQSSEEGPTSIHQALKTISATAIAAIVPKTPSPAPQEPADNESILGHESDEVFHSTEASTTIEEDREETPKPSLQDAVQLDEEVATTNPESEAVVMKSSEQTEHDEYEQQESQLKRESVSTASRPSTPQLGDAPQLSTPERRPLPPSPERRPGSSASSTSQTSAFRKSRDFNIVPAYRRPSSPSRSTSSAAGGSRPSSSSVLDRIRAMEARK